MGLKEFSRTERIAEQLRRELATLVSQDLEDPRVAGVVVSAVEVSKDLAHAKVLVTVPEGADTQKALAGLRSAAGYLRRKLGRRLHLRALPQLRFVHDVRLENALRLGRLIDTAIAEDQSKGGQD